MVKSKIDDPNDLSSAIGSVGKMMAEVSNSLDNLSHLEQVADNLGNLGAIDSLARAIAGYTVAQYGSDEDRAKIVEHFKEWFWESGIFKDK
jgi:hypothetical protein